MIQSILAATGVYAVRTHEDFVAKFRRALAERRAFGIHVVEHLVSSPVYARVDHGRWLFDCACNAGVAADPGWPDARCLDCGTIYERVVFPVNRDAIEAVLLLRPSLEHRNWRPGEYLGGLLAENIAHGAMEVK